MNATASQCLVTVEMPIPGQLLRGMATSDFWNSAEASQRKHLFSVSLTADSCVRVSTAKLQEQIPVHPAPRPPETGRLAPSQSLPRERPSAILRNQPPEKDRTARRYRFSCTERSSMLCKKPRHCRRDITGLAMPPTAERTAPRQGICGGKFARARNLSLLAGFLRLFAV